MRKRVSRFMEGKKKGGPRLGPPPATAEAQARKRVVGRPSLGWTIRRVYADAAGPWRPLLETHRTGRFPRPCSGCG